MLPALHRWVGFKSSRSWPQGHAAGLSRKAGVFELQFPIAACSEVPFISVYIQLLSRRYQLGSPFLTGCVTGLAGIVALDGDGGIEVLTAKVLA